MSASFIRAPFAPDPTQRIWRYMSIEKFIHLVATRSLFFSRVDRLSDGYEGSITRKDADLRKYVRKQIERMQEAGEIEGEIETLEDETIRLKETTALMRRSYQVNCWHANTSESAAMWREYCDPGRGIAITSTCQRLADSLPPEAEIGKVIYVDYAQHITPQAGPHSPYLQKLASYDHEREIRALYFNPFVIADDGTAVPCELEKLIQEIYVAPNCSPLYRDAVRMVLDVFGRNFALFSSTLDEKPLF